MSENAGGALAGIKVIEFSQNLAVPQCGRLLAGMGADVVKVEPPEGDNMRHLAPLAAGESRAFATANVGKRDLVLDLTAPRAGEVVDALVRWADIVLVGLKKPDHERFGLTWEHIHRINPQAVHLAFTAFGPEGPDADQGGYDVLVQALSGLGFSMNRTVDGIPRSTRPAFVDCASGLAAALGVVTALRTRDATGQGVRVDASLLGTAMLLGTPMMARFEADNETLETLQEEIDLLRQSGVEFEDLRTHYESRVVAGSGAFALYFRPYRTADGLVSVAGISPRLFEKFHEITGVGQPPPSRNPNDLEFKRVIADAEVLFASETTQHWLTTLRAAGYPCQRYNLPYEAVNDPQVRANDYVVDIEHPTIGTFSTVGMPFSFDSSPSGISGPSPQQGAHTAEVLAEAGLDAATVADLLGDATVAGSVAAD